MSSFLQRAVLVLVTVPLWLGCKPPEAVPVPAPRLVLTHIVEAPSPTVFRSFSGVTRAADSADLGFEVAGRITELLAVQGVRYEKGAVLARLDVANYQSELDRVQAESTRVGQDLKRVQQLFERGNSSKAQLDSAIAAHRTATAALATAEKKVRDGVLDMPYTGFIAEVLSEPQEVVSAGQAVVRIQGEGAMEMEIGVPGDLLGLLSVGLAATVRIEAVQQKTFESTVIEMAAQASEDSTYAVALAIQGDVESLRSGLDGEATLELPNPHGATTAIPSVCLVGSPGGEYHVWVVQATRDGIGTLSKQPVETGDLRPDGRVEILSVLGAGARIVSRGVHRVRDGMEVRYE